MSKKQMTLLYVMLGIILVCLIGAIVVVCTGNNKSDSNSSTSTASSSTESTTEAEDTTEADDTASDTDESSDEQEDTTEAEEVASDSLVGSMMETLTPMMGLPTTVDEDSKQVLYYYELEDTDVADCKGVIGDVALADELVIFKASSSDKVDTIKAGCEARLEAQKKSFQDYIPEQYKRLDNTQIVTAGDYVMYVCSDSADDIVSKFNELAK